MKKELLDLANDPEVKAVLPTIQSEPEAFTLPMPKHASKCACRSCLEYRKKRSEWRLRKLKELGKQITDRIPHPPKVRPKPRAAATGIPKPYRAVEKGNLTSFDPSHPEVSR
jgi:hypothetical protein